MNNEKGAKLNFIPVFGKWLGVAMKAVTADGQTHVGLSGNQIDDASTGSETVIRFYQTMKNPSRITIHFFRDRKNSPLPLPRMAAGRMGEKQSFGFSLQDCDKSPDKKQQFLNLVFSSPEKPCGFKSLYVRIELPKKEADLDNKGSCTSCGTSYYAMKTLDLVKNGKCSLCNTDLPQELVFEKPAYLKIDLREKRFKDGNGFQLRAVEILEKEAPVHLQKVLSASEVQTAQN